MRFVLKVALNYRGCPIPLPDLVSIGAMGLVKAIEKYDHARGLKFISYAVWWIKAYITKALNEEGSLIRLPANQYIRIRRALNGNNKDPINEEINELINLTRKGHSIDACISEDSKTTYRDVIPDTRAEKSDLNAEINSTEKYTRTVLADLPKREARILTSLFGIGFEKPQTLREVGESLNVCHERIRQIRDQALHRLKNGKYKDILQEKLKAYQEATGY
jgi:RNA polymerase primary sigma factor